MTSPSLDVITSSQDLRWLLQSSLWTQPESSWQTLASFMPHEEPFGRPPAPAHDCCQARPRCPGATGRMRTKVTGRLDEKVGVVGVMVCMLFVKTQSGVKGEWKGPPADSWRAVM